MLCFPLCLGMYLAHKFKNQGYLISYDQKVIFFRFFLFCTKCMIHSEISGILVSWEKNKEKKSNHFQGSKCKTLY